MSQDWDAFQLDEKLDQRDYAERRVEGRIYLTRSFNLEFDTSRDFGHQARYAIRVFDPEEPEAPEDQWEWTEMEIYRSAAGRVQIKAMVAQEAGAVRQIKFEKLTSTKLESLMTLDRDRSQAFIGFVRALEYVDPAGSEESLRLSERMLRDLFRDPAALTSLYTREPEKFRDLIRNDSTADDLIALARRRDVVATFRTWLEDDAAFDTAAAEAGGPEKAWQKLFEENPWILGVGLGGQLLTSWDENKLEQVVAGYTVAGAGKRVDALLKTQDPSAAPCWPRSNTTARTSWAMSTARAATARPRPSQVPWSRPSRRRTGRRPIWANASPTGRPTGATCRPPPSTSTPGHT